MKIYTKSGDKGRTGIIGGQRLKKSDSRICAYGTIDEVNSWVGSLIAELPPTEFPQLITELTQIQILLFDLGTDLATPQAVKPYILEESQLKWLENLIDNYAEILPPIEKFILPGGHLISSHFHIARTVIRRSEREVTALMAEEDINPWAYKIINRLSDLFFLLARYVNFYYGKTEPFYERAGIVFH